MEAPIFKNRPKSEKLVIPKLEDFYLWVDALCLNQKDLEEKSRQIPRMENIYNSAERVYGWLGENEDDDDEDVKEAIAAANAFGMAYESGKLLNFSDDFYPTIFAGLDHLAKRPWFERIWVIQEVTLARNIPVLFAGGSWLQMNFPLDLIAYLIKFRALEISTNTSSWNFLRLACFWNVRSWYQNREIYEEVLSQTYLRTIAAMSTLLCRPGLDILKATLPHD